ncbi:MAG TPA: cyclopropane-fatty-acyl-phospholipid synthase family protein [Acidocella sp.]|jgi:cyclopropane-fatty-acyl-phospholipid synthase|nr:MAG: SAM-dependent methyltransferase [Acidocella sp. 20-58-15]HQT39699.1 cyclopropane-fatty-acyl-phospholipid synthase family protein [Acidocella sp.]
MTETTTANAMTKFPVAPPRDRRLQLALQFARLLRAGRLNLVLPDGSTHHFEGSEPGPTATMLLRDPRMITKLAFGGCLGLSEAYMDGMWESPNVTDVLRLGTANEQAFDAMLRGKNWARFASWIMHKLRPNTRKGSRKNIAEHYDLGNDFYSEWLDGSMTYSAALFSKGENDLQAAQIEKYRRLCRALDIQPGMSVLEIGCGWGGFAEVAAAEFGAIVTGITLSTEQLAFAQARMKKAGLADKVTLKLEDYRDTTGHFDRIASIEMFEAVGEEYWPVYFQTVRDRLRPGGQAGIQVITIADRFFADYRKTADFIQRYVFPGGMLPSPTRLHEEIAAAGMHLHDSFWFGRDYAETLNRWQASFQAAWDKITGLSSQYDDRFKRLWEFYLGYCEVGFEAGWTDVGQIVIRRA